MLSPTAHMSTYRYNIVTHMIETKVSKIMVTLTLGDILWGDKRQR